MPSTWDYFFETEPGADVSRHLEQILRDQRTCTNSDWEWLTRLNTLDPNGEFTLEEIDGRRLVASICPTMRSYRISIFPSNAFPIEPPSIDCDFQAGFEFNWEPAGDLSSILQSFKDYVTRLDVVVNSLQACDGFEFELKQFDLDDEEPNCIAATLIVRETGETLELLIDTFNPNSFPHRLNSSMPDRLRGLQCDSWNGDEPLVFNLENLLREADEKRD